MTNSNLLELEAAYEDAVRSQTRLQNALRHYKQVNTSNSNASERLKVAKGLIDEFRNTQPRSSRPFTLRS